MQVSLITAPGCNELRVCSTILAEGLGIAHKSLIATIKRHLPRIERFGRVLLRKAPLKTASGTQLVTLTDLNENQALFVGSLSENTEQVIDFKVVLIEEFAKARKAIAAHMPNTNLIQLVNDQMERLVRLERKLDIMHRERVRFIKARQAARQHRDDQRETDKKRRDVVAAVAKVMKGDKYACALVTWSDFWKNVKWDYAIDFAGFARFEGEHLIDVAVRVGKIDLVHEAATVYFAKHI